MSCCSPKSLPTKITLIKKKGKKNYTELFYNVSLDYKHSFEFKLVIKRKAKGPVIFLF